MNDSILLSVNELSELKQILKVNLESEKVVIFGSRVNGTLHDHSDVDLAIIGEEKLSYDLIAALREAFENATFSFRVDFLDYHRISKEFRSIIDETGVVLNYR